MVTPKPDYLSRDFESIKTSLLEYASRVFPEWTPASSGDFGMVMLELHAYMGDILSYYTDRAQLEAYLPTATQRDSVIALAHLLGYIPNSGSPAKGTVSLVTDKGSPATTVPQGTKFTTGRIPALDGPVTVESDVEVLIPANPEGTTAPVVVPVTEGSSVSLVKIGVSSGQPAQMLLLPSPGVYRETIQVFVEDGTGSVAVNPGTSQVLARRWSAKDHLLDASEDERAFEVQITDTSMFITFGDGINGRIPSTGLQIFASYRHGFGASGNLSSGQIQHVNDNTLGRVHVLRNSDGEYQSSVLEGGADPESTESIRFNAPRVYRTQNRVVTLQDHKDAALAVGGVTRAAVVSDTFTSVTVYITGHDGGIPSEHLKQLVTDSLESKTLAGVSVVVADPTTVTVNFGSDTDPISVEIWPSYSKKTVLAELERAIKTLAASVPLGEKLSVSQVYEAIMAVEGVRYVDVGMMARSDSAQSGTSQINLREWEVLTVGDLVLDVVGGVA